MKIEWKRVTWYSQIIAIVLFIGIFSLGIWFGMQLQKADLGLQSTNSSQ